MLCIHTLYFIFPNILHLLVHFLNIFGVFIILNLFLLLNQDLPTDKNKIILTNKEIKINFSPLL